jgi:hypothetical protein
MTSYARAIRGFDAEFCDVLRDKIFTTIAEASLLSDVNAIALRTGETLEALTSCLIAAAAMSPHFDTPSRLREFAEGLAKRIRRGVAEAKADPELRDFVARCFRGTDVEGNA